MLKGAFRQTLSVFDETVNDLKTLKYVCDFAMQLVYIAYLAFALISGSGILVTNIILVTLCTLYFIFFLFVEDRNMSREEKMLKKRVHRIYKLLRRATQAAVIVISAISLSGATIENNVIDILLLAVMIISFALQLVLDVTVWYVERRAIRFKEAFISDITSIRIVSDVISIVNDVNEISKTNAALTKGVKTTKIATRVIGMMLGKKKKEKDKIAAPEITEPQENEAVTKN